MDVNENMMYLKTEVRPVLEPLLTKMIDENPNDPVQWVIDYLEKEIASKPSS